MNIAICDDEKNVCHAIEEVLVRMAETSQKSIEVKTYYLGESLMEDLDKGLRYDLIFLDIEMGNLSGIDIGRLIRERLGDENTRIVYISWQGGYALDLFAVRPFDFLLKPIKEEKIEEVMATLDKVLHHEERYLYYTSNNTTKKIKIGVIQYVESDNRQVRVITENGEASFYGKLDEVFSQLDHASFWRIHKSYIINYKYVDQFDYGQVRMLNHQVLPISQSRRKLIRQLQMNLQQGGL